MSVLQRIERKIENMNTMLTRFGIDAALFARIGNGIVFTTVPSRSKRTTAQRARFTRTG